MSYAVHRQIPNWLVTAERKRDQPDAFLRPTWQFDL